jgi:hypothetical protein
VTARPAGPAAADQAAGDPTPLIPTAAAADPGAGPDRVTAREIVEFLHHLAELRDSSHSDDPGERAAFAARKADLFTRIAADPTALTAPEGRTP